MSGIIKSVFNDIYLKMGAKFVDFFGYYCPVYFESIIKEVLKVRNDFGVFDLFHMGRLILYKDSNLINIEKVLSVKLDSLKVYSEKGKAKYALILNDRGTIEDDIVIYDYFDKLFIVCNACNKEKIKVIFDDLGLRFEDVSSEILMLAIQGPSSAKIVEKFFNIDLSNIYFYEYLILEDIILSRTGYTGEDGFEVYCKVEKLTSFLNWIIDNYGMVMCGLGARDTLRIEAGLPLYGNEIDEKTNPIEANLKWAVNVERNFVPTKFLKYFSIDNSKKIPRKGDKVYFNDIEIGYVTSGTFSPIFNKPIGMLYVFDVYNEYRIKDLVLKVSDKPLLKNNYYRLKR